MPVLVSRAVGPGIAGAVDLKRVGEEMLARLRRFG